MKEVVNVRNGCRAVAALLPLLLVHGPVLACDKCPSASCSPNPLPPGKAVLRSIKYFNRCVDFDNIPPGHCCIVPFKNYKIVAPATKQAVGTLTVPLCGASTPTTTPCNDPAMNGPIGRK